MLKYTLIRISSVKFCKIIRILKILKINKIFVLKICKCIQQNYMVLTEQYKILPPLNGKNQQK